MENVISAAILVLIIGLAVFYVIRAKKKGKKCIGCPEEFCSRKMNGSSYCSCSTKSKFDRD